jgi:basic membrane lipoprotein Med (substrate-binding protein (PBP1-ABC) superfamily)
MWRYCQGFRAGAEYKNEQVQVLIAFHQAEGSEDLFSDEGWAAATTEEMILRGADVIYGVGGRLGQEALRAAARAGAWSIGAERDQFFITREARRGLLTSSVPRADETLYQFIKDLQAGRVAAELQGRMALAPYHEGESFVSLSLQAALLQLKEALESGLVQVNIEGTR